MDTFLVVQLGDNLQMDNLLKSMLVKFEKNFVESYWQHVVMSVSKTRYTEEETKSAQGNQKINLTTVLRWDTVTISLLLHLLSLNCPFHPSGVYSRFTHMRFAFPPPPPPLPPPPFKQINVSGQVTLAGGRWCW